VPLLTIKDQPLRDAARGRTILTRAYAPEAPGRYPVIIFSHGFSADLGSFQHTGRWLAERGYVVLHPTHADSINVPDPSVDPREAAIIRHFIASRAAGIDADIRRAFVSLLDNPFYLESRLADIGVLVRNLDAGGGLDPDIVDRADVNRLGIAGHSYGAYTATVIAGARLERNSVAASDPMLRRFSAALAISGQGAGRMSFSDGSFASVRLPLFGITGTRDIGAAGETPEWRLQSFRDSPPGDKFAAVVNGFGHTDFDPPGDDPNRAAQGQDLRGLELAFWEGYLKDSADSRATLAARARASSANDPIVMRAR
jgi:dienelactone hydrolase